MNMYTFFSRNQWLTSLVILFMALPAAGQTGRTDQQVWLGVNTSGSFHKGWSASAQFRVRFVDNVTTYKGAYLYLAGAKQFNKRNSVEANYRLAVINETKGVRTYHRFALGYERTFKFSHMKLYLRPMVQYQQQASQADVDVSYKSKAYFRPRVTLKRELSDKVDLYIYGEPFFRLNKGVYIDWWQNSLGLRYQLKKSIRLNPYMIWQPDFTGKLFHTNFIYGLDVEFRLGKLSGKGDKPASIN